MKRKRFRMHVFHAPHQMLPEDLRIALGFLYDLKAHVEEINGLSGHADYQEMLAYLKKMDTSALKKIFLVHGDPEAQIAFKKFLMDNGFPNVVIVEKNKKYTLE